MPGIILAAEPKLREVVLPDEAGWDIMPASNPPSTVFFIEV